MRDYTGRWRLLALAVALLAAGGTALSGRDQEPEVAVQLKVMRIGRGDFSGIFVQPSERGEPQELSFSRHRRSQAIQYTGPGRIVFFRFAPPPEPDAPPLRLPVAVFEIDLENPVRELLLFFLPVPNPEQRKAGEPLFQLFGMDDSFEAFPRDTAIIFNATGATLYGQVNRRNQVFSAGASKPFALNRDFNAAFAVETRDGPRLVFENTLEFSEDLRAIVMLRPPSRARSIRIESYNILERLDPAVDE